MSSFDSPLSHGTVREFAFLLPATSEAEPNDLPGAYSDDVSIDDLRALSV